MVKLFFSSLLLSTIFSLNFSAKAQTLPGLRQDMTYKQARKLLIQSGWQAVFNLSQVNNPDRSSVIDYLITQKGYTELVDCSGTGLGLCLFEFRNATGQKLFITTSNNAPQEESMVFGWRLEDRLSRDNYQLNDLTTSINGSMPTGNCSINILKIQGVYEYGACVAPPIQITSEASDYSKYMNVAIKSAAERLDYDTAIINFQSCVKKQHLDRS